MKPTGGDAIIPSGGRAISDVSTSAFPARLDVIPGGYAARRRILSPTFRGDGARIVVR